MRYFFKIIRCVLTSGIVLLHYWFWYFIPFSRHPEKYPFEYRYAIIRKASVKILKGFRANLRTQGVEELYKSFASGRGTLIVSNHISAFDVITLVAIVDRPFYFVAKKELYKTPFLGRCTRAIGALFLDRDDPRQAIEILHKTSEILSSGGIVAVYPEGTRNKDPLNTPPASFHAGSLKCALRGKANIIVSASFGSFRYLGKGDYFRSYPVNFDFLKAHPYNEIEKMTTIELASLTYEEMDGLVNELKKKDEEYIGQGLAKKKMDKWWEEPLFQLKKTQKERQ